MRDERVRPQVRRKTKKGWKSSMGKGANHMVLEGQTVKIGEKFDLGDGVKADTPGKSGVAGHDINCRCFVTHDWLTAEEYAAAVKKQGDKTVDKSAESGIIKNIDVDDLELAVYGKDVDEKAVKIIKKYFVDNSLADGYYINNISMKSIQNDNEKEKGRPLIQTIANKRGNMYETDIVLNEDIFKGRSIDSLNEMLKNYKNNIAQTFEEAVIHEVGHAKTIFSNRFRDIEAMYDKLEKMGVEGISAIALNDGAEAVAEIEILIHRGSVIPKQAKELYDKVMSGKLET